MADSVVAMRQADAPDVMAVLVQGKIANRKRHNGRVHTEVRLKAVDEYTRPGVVTVGSDQPIGAVGDIVSVNCALSGYYGGKMTRRDQHTGEVEEWFPVRMTLDAIDFADGDNRSAQSGRSSRPGSF